MNIPNSPSCEGFTQEERSRVEDACTRVVISMVPRLKEGDRVRHTETKSSGRVLTVEPDEGGQISVQWDGYRAPIRALPRNLKRLR